MANLILPIFMIAMLPFDIIAGLSKGLFPSQATLMAVGGALIGLYLARKLWGGGAEKLMARSRLQFINQQGQSFDPQSDEAQAQLDNSRLNFWLGAGLLTFGIFLTICFISSYLVTTAFPTSQTAMGAAVQIAIAVLFNLLVIGVEALGATIFLKR